MALPFLLVGESTAQVAFGPPVDYGLSFISEMSRLVDVDRDGDLDLVAVLATAELEVLINSGLGTFQNGIRYVCSSNCHDRARLMSAGDLNRDGWEDIVTTGFASPASGVGMVGVWLSDRLAGFLPPVYYPVSAPDPYFVTCADITQDHVMDVIVGNVGQTNTASSGAGILVGRGDGTLQAHSILPGTAGLGAISTAVADLDGDRLQDLVCSNWSAHTITISWGVPGGVAPAVPLPMTMNFPYGVQIADMDTDGLVDLVGGESPLAAPALWVIKNLGARQFGPIVRHPLNYHTEYLEVADFDGDADLDAIVSAHDLRVVFVVVNLGSLTFSSSTLPTLDRTRTVTLGDVDLDGRVDLVAPRYSGVVRLFPNISSAAGSGLFGTAGTGSYGPLRMSCTRVPQLGSMAEILIENAPPFQPAFWFLGASRLIPPLLLDSVGGQSSAVFTSPDAWLGSASERNQVAVANDPAMRGVVLFCQSGVVDAGSVARLLVLSNPITLRLW